MSDRTELGLDCRYLLYDEKDTRKAISQLQGFLKNVDQVNQLGK
jgi:hypothetical protein